MNFNDNAKVLWGVLGGILLGAYGAAVIKRGNLRPNTAKILSYGYDIKDRIVEQCETIKEDCQDMAAEAKEHYEVRKEENLKKAERASK
jgi:hypothetical protein